MEGGASVAGGTQHATAPHVNPVNHVGGAEGKLAVGYFADFVALDRDVIDETATPEREIWQAAVLGTWSGGERVWAHPCMRRRDAARGGVGGGAGGSAGGRGGAAGLRACVEAERARAPPSESTLERLRRLAAAHGDGCPF